MDGAAADDLGGWNGRGPERLGGWNAAAASRPGRLGPDAGDDRDWERNTRDDRAAWDAGAGREDRAGWDRDAAWGAGQGFGSQAGWNDAPTDTAWAATGSPVALLSARGASGAGRAGAGRAGSGAQAHRPAPTAHRPVRAGPVRAGRRQRAWLSMDKSVTLTVDGEARAVKTYASTVGGVLDDQKITVGGHDTLAPAREARISDGAEIVLRRGRLVTLTVDGKTRQVWTTGTTVQEALEQIGYRQAGPVDVVGPVDRGCRWTATS